jgi:opine dehydrogenase
MAAHLTLEGFAVRLFEMPRFAENIRPAQERGGIELTGVVGEGFAKLELTTTDVAQAIQGVSHIFVVTQALAHEEIAQLCAPHLEEDQTIILFPGSGGALQVAKTLRDEGITTKKIYIAETVTLPYACRIKGPAWVNVHSGPAAREIIAAFPGKDIDAVIELLHPIGVIFSLARIEYSKGEFWMYKEAFTPSVMKLLKALERERVAMLREVGVEPMEFGAYYEHRYQKPWSDFAAVASKGPASANTRYISEDIPIGMVLWASLGDMLGIPTPTAQSLIHISSVIHDTDYWQGGRTVEKLGLADMTAAELNRYLLEGSAQAD